MNVGMVRDRRRRRVLAALVLAATLAATGSAWAAAPVAPPAPGSTWTDSGQGTVTAGIPLPQGR